MCIDRWGCKRCAGLPKRPLGLRHSLFFGLVAVTQCKVAADTECPHPNFSLGRSTRSARRIRWRHPPTAMPTNQGFCQRIVRKTTNAESLANQGVRPRPGSGDEARAIGEDIRNNPDESTNPGPKALEQDEMLRHSAALEYGVTE